GSILAVPVLVYLLGQDAVQATTGSLVVVGATSLIAALSAYRAGNVQLGSGLAFGVLAIGGAVLGARASTRVPDAVLLAAFAVLMLLVGGLMAARHLRRARAERSASTPGEGTSAPGAGPHTRQGPILTLRGGFGCHGARALKLLASATA